MRVVFHPKPGERVGVFIDLENVDDIRGLKFLDSPKHNGQRIAYEMFYDQIADTPYEVHTENEIVVCDTEGKAVPFGQISPLSRALNQELMFRRIHVAPQWRDMAQEAVKAVTG